MDLISPFLPLVQSLGPWGWALAAGIALIQWRRNGGKLPLGPPPAPPAPAPGPVVVPTSPVILPNNPILDDLLKRVLDRVRLPVAGPVAFGAVGTDAPAVMTTPGLLEQRAAIAAEIATRRADLAAELKALDQAG